MYKRQLNAQVIFGDALHGHPLDARIPANAVVLVYDQVAHRDFAQTVQRIFAALFLLLCAAHAEGPRREERELGKGQAAPGGELPRQDLHLSLIHICRVVADRFSMAWIGRLTP